MTFGSGCAVSLVNGRVLAGADVVSSIRFGARILALDEAPAHGDLVVNLDGAFVLPGLVNAHDHLELNHYGALKARDRYQNATEWIDDLRPIIRSDPEIRRKSSLPLADRLFIGGLKNLLAGTTTVAHHNPLYRGIARHVPLRVVQHFGWAHSFALENAPVGANGEAGGRVRDRCHDTPPAIPFIVHAGEGIDAAAAQEICRLHALDCLRANTVLVHGVALTPSTWTLATTRGTSLAWCPASNHFLFGRTLPISELTDRGRGGLAHVCLGTDSRLTGSRDLLDELRVAARWSDPETLLPMVTTTAARILRLPAGVLRVSAAADLIVVRPRGATAAESLVATRRTDVALVVIGGRPMVAAPAFAPLFDARGSGWRPLMIDDVHHVADAALRARIDGCSIAEDGVACA
jgi:cytosine/adenosine deaminase-related metal-dependent hydrolase